MAEPFLLKNAKEKLQKLLEAPEYSELLATFHNLNTFKYKRIERREALVKTADYFLQFTDVFDFRIGFYNDKKEFVNKSDLRYVAKIIGLPFSRVRRAFRDMIKAGYVAISQKIVSSSQRAYYIVKRFTMQFFLELGLRKTDISSQQHYMRCRLEKIEKKEKKRMYKHFSEDQKYEAPIKRAEESKKANGHAQPPFWKPEPWTPPSAERRAQGGITPELRNMLNDWQSKEANSNVSRFAKKTDLPVPIEAPTEITQPLPKMSEADEISLLEFLDSVLGPA